MYDVDPTLHSIFCYLLYCIYIYCFAENWVGIEVYRHISTPKWSNWRLCSRKMAHWGPQLGLGLHLPWGVAKEGPVTSRFCLHQVPVGNQNNPSPGSGSGRKSETQRFVLVIRYVACVLTVLFRFYVLNVFGLLQKYRQYKVQFNLFWLFIFPGATATADFEEKFRELLKPEDEVLKWWVDRQKKRGFSWVGCCGCLLGNSGFNDVLIRPECMYWDFFGRFSGRMSRLSQLLFWTQVWSEALDVCVFNKVTGVNRPTSPKDRCFTVSFKIDARVSIVC